ncbi:hypothetical protein [Corynebacterium ammoniagenes]|uniref:Transcriptional regulator n=2 Tax=Corynebacterium ammoniagenes TaxID=1697 RepID=A0AAV5G3X5_CORAM|nr:hypothetical protein [Corynebacterium ammoniagenes]APT83308.1 hypothetical protein CAMM_10445 [Corynebacterium ammoniagenes DSM 20306]AQS74323.1 hypothetical protein CA40472_10785 [Corynebacterium ammoniagenes]EFG81446.1 hypothetical protein HMPREF0281_01219 [Corynebacterium ammoniagenes DSM 20306]GJN43934.1 hypothetical protein CAT723_24130 [Corynebacterium ammoniagenes]
MRVLPQDLTPGLARAGRALAQINSLIISEEAGLTRQQVRDFEKRVGSLTLDEKTRLQKTLESYGVVFIAEEENLGHGVRKRYTTSKLRQIKRWEDEGGLANEDDN